jgi:hypothetical protein
MSEKPLPFMALAVLAGFAFLGVQGAPARGTATTKWEYRTISVVRAAEHGAEWTRWFETATEGRRELPRPVDTQAKIAALGEEGWELVGVTPISSNTGGHTTQGYGSSDMAGFTSQLSYFFKRPK